MTEISHREILDSFTEGTLPTLDIAVLGALELFSERVIPSIPSFGFKKPLVLGSGNAFVTGEVLFQGMPATFGNENNYVQKMENEEVDGVIIISSSGGKHAISMAKSAKERGLPMWLLTNAGDAPASSFVASEQVVVFPKNREPYTYNTSTYLSMFLAKEGGDTRARAEQTISFIKERVLPSIPNTLASYDSFFFIIPPEILPLRSMFLTKFDELFQPVVSGRVFSIEEAKHAKTIIPSEKECFVSFGDVVNNSFGSPSQRVHIPFPLDSTLSDALAIVYFTIGHIQKQHPPYFANNIEGYIKEAEKLFGHQLSVIVE